MAEPVELFTWDYDFDPENKGKPVLGIWVARHDAPVPTGRCEPLPDDYELIGTAREVTPVEVQHEPDWSILDDSWLSMMRDPDRHLDIRWVARTHAWLTLMDDPRECRRLVAQWGIERTPGAAPVFDTFDRLVIYRLGRWTLEYLRTSTEFWPERNGAAMTLFLDPDRLAGSR